MGIFSFPKSFHLRRSADFRLVFGCGSKKHTRGFIIFRTPNKLGYPRLGLSIGRKLGKAPQRNKLKRLVRESFRLNWKEWQLAGNDVVVVAKRGSARLSFHEVSQDLALTLAPRGRRV